MRRRWRCAVGGVLCALALGCASPIVHPTDADLRWAKTQWPDASLEALAQGRELYVRKCAGCHNLYRPVEYLPGHWPALVAEMADDAGLDAAEQERISRYLSAASARLGR